MKTINIPAGVEMTVQPHESERGKYKWRVRGVGIIQRAGIADNASEAAIEASKAIIPKLVLVKG